MLTFIAMVALHGKLFYSFLVLTDFNGTASTIPDLVSEKRKARTRRFSYLTSQYDY